MSGIPDGQSSLVVILLGLVLCLVEGCVYTLKHPQSTLLTHPHTTPNWSYRLHVNSSIILFLNSNKCSYALIMCELRLNTHWGWSRNSYTHTIMFCNCNHNKNAYRLDQR